MRSKAQLTFNDQFNFETLVRSFVQNGISKLSSIGDTGLCARAAGVLVAKSTGIGDTERGAHQVLVSATPSTGSGDTVYWYRRHRVLVVATPFTGIGDTGPFNIQCIINKLSGVFQTLTSLRLLSDLFRHTPRQQPPGQKSTKRVCSFLPKQVGDL